MFGLFKKKQSKLGRISNTIADKLKSEENEEVSLVLRLKTAIPNKHGLYPHEVLILDYANSFYTEDNNFQGFWWYKYGVKNVYDCLDSLIDRGFLEIGDVQNAVAKESVTVLKEELKKRGLKISGRKTDLINRLLQEVSYEELNHQFRRRTYQLTKMGKEALAEEQYVPYIHCRQYDDLDIWSLNKLMHTPPQLSYRDRIWGYLNKKSMEHFEASNFGLYRNCRYHMHQFLMEENRVEDALEMLAEVVYYDLSGLGNGYQSQLLHTTAEYFFPYSKSIAKTAPGIINAILVCQKEIGITDIELRRNLLRQMNMLSAPFHLFEAEECINILFMEIYRDEEALNKMYAVAERRYKLKYKSYIK